MLSARLVMTKVVRNKKLVTRTAGKGKDAKKSGVSESSREGSGKWLCET